MTKTRDLADLGGGFIQAGTGAMQRTVESKLQDVVSVKDFGAVGNGGIDDTNSINLAIAALNNSSIRSLYFPSGHYRITSALTPITANRVTIYGDGPRNSVITQYASADTFWFKSTNPLSTELADLTLHSIGINQAATNPTAGIALRLSRVTRGYFTDIDLRNVYQGILIEGGNDLHFDALTVAGSASWTSLQLNSYLLWMTNYTGTVAVPSEIFFSNFNIKGSNASYQGKCFVIQCGDGIWFDTGHLGFSYYTPLFLNPQNDASLSLLNIEISNVYIDGNNAGDSSSNGVALSGSTTPTVRHIKFDGCVVKNFLGNGVSFDLSTLRDLRITDSLIADNGGHGVIINQADEVIVSSNTIRYNNRNNVSCDAISLAGVNTGIISGNLVLAGEDPHLRGIQINNTCSDLIVTNNALQGHTTDINVGSGASRINVSANRKVGSSPSVVAADGFTLPLGYSVVIVTGNTTFSNISATNIENYIVTLRFTGTPTVNDSAGNISLAGSFTATPGSTLTLMNTGTGWVEVSRAVV